MSGSFRIGRVFGIAVKIHWTFFLLLTFFAFVGYRISGNLADGLGVVGIIVALFVCVLLHEFGHSVVARKLGVGVRDVTILPIGGLARLKSFPEKPLDEVGIAVAGPLVNVVLVPMFFGVAYIRVRVGLIGLKAVLIPVQKDSANQRYKRLLEAPAA